jgi:hypothetical protein
VHLFVREEEGWFVNLLEKCHGVMLPFSCLQLNMCTAYAECGSLFLKYVFSESRFEVGLVCPTYEF